ncbi:MAG TPA: polysaccharide deacetylase family protein [Solirubrobacter sp.]|nr:polysaccharide deacetylase family protein [Solirubrobacter sp.]
MAGLAVAGISAVSIPVTVALVLSTTGASDALTIGSEPQRSHPAPTAAVERARCTPSQGYYALTFEGGPNAATTRRLVATLKRSRAVATFFDVGGNAARRVDLVELQRTVGHVANNGYSNTALDELPSEQRIRELQDTARVLDYPNVWFRPPYGRTSAELDEDVRRSGLTAVYWTVDASGATLPAKAIVARALKVKPGGIIRLYEGSEATIEATPEIVRELRERGLCPGFLGHAKQTVKAANGITFRVWAVKP